MVVAQCNVITYFAQGRFLSKNFYMYMESGENFEKFSSQNFDFLLSDPKKLAFEQF